MWLHDQPQVKKGHRLVKKAVIYLSIFAEYVLQEQILFVIPFIKDAVIKKMSTLSLFGQNQVQVCFSFWKHTNKQFSNTKDIYLHKLVSDILRE